LVEWVSGDEFKMDMFAVDYLFAGISKIDGDAISDPRLDLSGPPFWRPRVAYDHARLKDFVHLAPFLQP